MPPARFVTVRGVWKHEDRCLSRWRYQKLNPHRWIEITPSEYAWEREALDYLKTRLPDGEPFRAWSNFEFIAHDGSINEVDLLVVSLHTVYLVEIKSWPGVVSGDQSTWRRTVGGRKFLADSPLLLTNRKARKLATLLKGQPALAKERKPYLEPVVFLSRARCRLEGLARTGVYVSAESVGLGEPSIVDVLSGNAGFDPRRPPPPIDRPLARALARAMEQAGIRPSQRRRRVSDYVLRELLLETDAWQDWEAEHVTVPSSKRRVRIYPLARASSEAGRAARRRAAEHEYRLLDGIAHDGILRVELLTDAEQGPAVVFEHDPAAERLDHFLDRRGDELAADVRLDMVRQLAETLQYAHERRLYHRGLSPQRVLVMKPEAPRPRLKIFDWQTGKHAQGRDGATPGSGSTTALGVAIGDPDAVYLAPETSLGGLEAAKLDLFSLGTIAYRLFAGTPPAPTVEALHARLSTGHGLKLSDELAGAPESLQFVVACATDPEVTRRPDSVAEFLEQLDEAERELAAAKEPPEDAVHPLDAATGDLLEHGFLVVRRLGRGATAMALQVEHDDGSGVLKVALDPSHNERIRREGELLRTLRHPHIVEGYRELELSGHAAIFMAMAGADNKSGTYTLADRIREEGRLSLDLLQRFGDQLLNVVQWLEEKGVSHRDLKPDNIGVSGKPLSLVVFDFSLTDTPAENIRAGTPLYRDPFLPQRTPPRWDAYAERFSAAMTLHEMATGQLPGWGDGLSDPALIDDEVSIDAELFDPSVREALTEFFGMALARDYRKRFDNAEELRRAWFRCFETIDLAPGGDDDGDLPEQLDGVTEATPLEVLGLSPRLLNALERLGAHTVAELVSLPRIRLYRNKGIGQRIVKRIRELSERLAEHLVERGRLIDTTTTGDEPDYAVDPAAWSVDLLASRLILSRRSGQAGDDAHLVRWALGLQGGLDLLLSQQAVADRQSASSPEVKRAMRRVRERWQRQGWLKPLRESVATLVARHGGIMTARELAEALAAARGSTADGGERLRRAAAATAAALEAESQSAKCRYRLYRSGATTLVLATAALDAAITADDRTRVGYVRKLGEVADRIAAADPLASLTRVQEEIAGVEPPPGMRPLNPERRVRLAVQVAGRAALSSRGELYPRGMPAGRAVKLGASSLLGPKALAVAQLRERLASRYPEAEALPDRPVLDALLTTAGLQLVWDRKLGKYRSQTPHPSHLTSSSTTAADAVAEEADAADTLDERLQRTIAAKGFLALSVPPRYFTDAERYLAASLALSPFSLEAALIRHMQEVARNLGADWKVVVAADSAPPGSSDHRRLHRLVHRAAAELQRELAGTPEPLLVTRCGLLARYRHLDLLTAVQDDCQRGTAAAARVLCIAGRASARLPAIDDQPLPLVVASAWAQPGVAWLTRTSEAPLQRSVAGFPIGGIS